MSDRWYWRGCSSKQISREPAAGHYVSSHFLSLVGTYFYCHKMSSEETPCNKKIKLEVMDLEDICTGVENVSDSVSRTNSDSNGSLLLDFRGPCKFGYYFRKEGLSSLSANSSWSFSQILGQVFLRMGNVLHVQFSLDESKAPSSKLSIRATPVFCSADYMHQPVERWVVPVCWKGKIQRKSSKWRWC